MFVKCRTFQPTRIRRHSVRIEDRLSNLKTFSFRGHYWAVMSLVTPWSSESCVTGALSIHRRHWKAFFLVLTSLCGLNLSVLSKAILPAASHRRNCHIDTLPREPAILQFIICNAIQFIIYNTIWKRAWKQKKNYISTIRMSLKFSHKLLLYIKSDFKCTMGIFYSNQ